MDIPPVAMALAYATDMSDLSDPPSDVDDSSQLISSSQEMDIDEINSSGSDISPPRTRLGRHDRPWALSPGKISSLPVDGEPAQHSVHDAQKAPSSSFESLPIELHEKIAINLEDSDFRALSLSCWTFARRLIPENSGIWEARFLSLYDFPLVSGTFDFCAAYRLRRLVLRNFRGFGNAGKRGEVQLEVLRDMVVETYNRPKKQYSTMPGHSKNLRAFGSGLTSPWMVNFLSSPFFAHDSSTFGEPNVLFDALQIVFSHLVLNQCSSLCFGITPLRENYDIELVYLWNKSLETIFHQLPPPGSTSVRASSLEFDPEPEYYLDLHSLLHIRNFWQRHLSEEEPTTYANMTLSLEKLNHLPKKSGWSRPLQAPSRMEKHWIGHYTCIHPWPKTKLDLEERQTCAEDWSGIVHPLTLNIETTKPNTTGKTSGWWPSIFHDIPAIKNSIPKIIDCRAGEPPYTYLRGLAPFMDPSAAGDQQPLKYHPFLALRIRGIIHPIPDQTEIPGWNHIVMVLYKPTTRYLVDVYEKSLELYGNPFQQQTGNALAAPTQLQGQGQGEVSGPDGNVVAMLDGVELEKALSAQLRLELDRLKGPCRIGRDLVLEMEDQYGEPGALAWGDVDYAFAYEGVLVPGGLVMLGRWWQVGPDGLGDAMEIGSSGGGRQRGAFVFWA